MGETLTPKGARGKAELTQEEACKRIGISRSTLQNYEKFKTVPPVSIAKKMAEVYGVSVNDIDFSK